MANVYIVISVNLQLQLVLMLILALVYPCKLILLVKHIVRYGLPWLTVSSRSHGWCSGEFFSIFLSFLWIGERFLDSVVGH